MVVPRENAIDEIETAVTPLVLTEKVNEIIGWINDMMTSLYPVGSVYLTTASTCPLATLIPNSTWVLVSQDRVLQGSSTNHTAGSTIEAGLPNITGHFNASRTGDTAAQNIDMSKYNSGGNTGCLKGTTMVGTDVNVGTATRTSGKIVSGMDVDASESSSIYGNSTTVQPPAYVVNVFKRTA